MKIIIHRGLNQIGGCITEIATANHKILIDLGHNLPNGDFESYDPNANEKAVAELTKGCDAIFYTHYHGDHIDLFPFVHHTPQYMGPVAKEVMLCKYKRLVKLPACPHITEQVFQKLSRFSTYRVATPVTLGDISVTPFFVNHSAYDSYMLLIEAEGKTVLHTGDFRGHGYTGDGLMKMINKYIVPRGVDILITEGTMLGRGNERVLPEKDLLEKAKRMLGEHKYVFVLCSSTDIDRLATFHEAAKVNGKSVLCDSYQKEILEIFTRTAGNYSSLYHFNNVYYFAPDNRKQLDLIKKGKGNCILIRPSMPLEKIRAKIDLLGAENVFLIYSAWKGYIEEGKPYTKQSYCDLIKMFPQWEYLHTAGHADKETLALVCETIHPKKYIIPIHTDSSDKFDELNLSDELKQKIFRQPVLSV